MANADTPVHNLWEEYWHRGSIVTASEQHTKDVEQAFYVGFYAAMGYVARANKMDEKVAIGVVNLAIKECRDKIMPAKLKFTASVDGNEIT